jgi:hypothetical protein
MLLSRPALLPSVTVQVLVLLSRPTLLPSITVQVLMRQMQRQDSSNEAHNTSPVLLRKCSCPCHEDATAIVESLMPVRKPCHLQLHSVGAGWLKTLQTTQGQCSTSVVSCHAFLWDQQRETCSYINRCTFFSLICSLVQIIRWLKTLQTTQGQCSTSVVSCHAFLWEQQRETCSYINRCILFSLTCSLVQIFTNLTPSANQ